MILILVFIIILSNTLSVYAYNIGATFISSNVIAGKIYFEETDSIDISKIKLNVFRLELLKEDEVSSEYAHIYETSVSPDKEGNITINRPSSYCYVEIDTESIPGNFGVDKDGSLISLNENEFSFTLSPISDFKIDFSNDEIEFYNKEKTHLFVNSKEEEKCKDDVKTELKNNKNVKKAHLDSENMSVESIFNDFFIESKQPIDNLSTIEKIDYLCKKNVITEEEKISLYIGNLKNKQINEENEIIKALSVVSSFKLNNELSEELSEEINSLERSNIPTYENEKVYTDRFFTIHYEDGMISSNNLHALAVYLNFTKVSLCSTFEFETPNLAPGESTYQVYITSEQGYSGLTVPVSNSGNIYTFININIDDGNNTLSNYSLGTACHEFMHAIQFQYNSYSVKQHSDEMVHFNEAVANSVKVRLVENCGIQYFVNNFQNSPEVSLLSSSTTGSYPFRCYGAVLFPLCVEQEYSDFNTIRKIYEEIYEEDISVRDVYTAIDNVLKESDSSIQEAYTKCALYNYNIQYYYDYCETNWKTCAKLSSVTPTAKNYDLSPLSTRYFEITDPSYNGFAVTFSSSDYINYAELQRVDTIDDELSRTHYSIFTQNITAIFNVDYGQKTCMILSNVSLNAPMTFSVRVVS